MVVRAEAWPEGFPAWADLTVGDPEVSKAFYSGLFGWQFETGSEEFGGYSNAMLDGETVAAVYPVMPGDEDAPRQWVTYFAVDDAQVTADKIKKAGGNVVLEPMEVGTYGTMGVFVGPDGAFFGIWQAGEHTGYNRIDEPGAVVWTELMSREYETAKSFYAEVFGYSYSEMPAGGDAYSTITLGDQIVAGIGELTEANAPAEVPSFWGTYFGGEDIEDAVAKTVELGGQQVREPFDTPFGRMSTVSGPDGEFFSIITVRTAA